MRDNLMGGLLAFGVAAPIMIVCCGGGTALLAAVFGGFGAWLSGWGGLAIAFVAALAFLVVREFRRASERAAETGHCSDRKNAT
jgi:membrane protein implicated in regulation of membrane protease activity